MPFLVAGTATVADARPAADAVTVETPDGSSANPTTTVSDGWKPLASSSMSSPVPRVSLAAVAMFFVGNNLMTAIAGVVLFVAFATVVDVVDVVEDDVDVLDVEDVDDEPDDDAAGVPLTAFDAVESPTVLTALIVMEYAVPFVRPVMVNGLVVDAGERAV